MALPAFKAPYLVLIIIISIVAWAQGEDKIWSHEAKNHIGEYAMVCGVIVGVRRERQAPQPRFQGPSTDSTILYFDKLPPHHEFVAVIEDVNRRAFPDEPESFVDQKTCVYGKILKYKGMKVIALVRAEQITVVGKGKNGE